ncbi:unnamed protein product [Paramecium pentaurelia]|uniref:Uncharacterized protein n=1 Tax=Paramecium pentaurelia TaxID=43138 RepID=A0A8S1SI81_9CILI|nr:unnamed protein product [Paramecium pentaurelia]
MNSSPTKFDTPTKMQSKIDLKMRKSGVPIALKRSPQFQLFDCFMLTYFHIPSFAEQILQYDDSIINEEGVTLLLQKLFIQLIYCKKKDTSALDVYQFMKDDYNTRFKSVEEFLVRFFEKVDESISKYRTMLNQFVEEHPIRELFIGKFIKGNDEKTFNLIKIDLDDESFMEGLQKKFELEDCSIKELPKILQFEITRKSNLLLMPTIYLDQFMHSNKGTIKQHQSDIKELTMKREEIVQKIKNIENYQQTSQSIPQILQMTINIIQEQREELIDGDPAIEGFISLIMDSNQELEKLKEELHKMDQQIKQIMGSFNKIEYNLHAVIIYDGDYECVYIKNNEQCFFFEDGFAEVRKKFEIEIHYSPETIVYLVYQDKNLKSDYSFTGGQGNLLDMDDRKPYESLIRKDLQQYAVQFNQKVDQELLFLKQQQQAEEVFQQYLTRLNIVIQLVQKKNTIQVPHLNNFATFLFYSQKKIDDYVKWQILDCSIRDVTGQSIQDIKNMNAFAQKLSVLLQNQPQKAPTQLTVNKKDMQIMQIRLTDYVQYQQCTKVLTYSLECILQEKKLLALNAIRFIYDNCQNNIIAHLNQEILKALMIHLSILTFKFHQQQNYCQFWDHIQWIMAYWPFINQQDLVHQQIFIIIKDLKKRANKKALNSDQQKIFKKFITSVEDKKPTDIGSNFLLRQDPVLEAIAIIDWNQDHYYWIPDKSEDISQLLLTNTSLIQQYLQLEFQFVKNIMQQQQTFTYEERIKMMLHSQL